MAAGYGDFGAKGIERDVDTGIDGVCRQAKIIMNIFSPEGESFLRDQMSLCVDDVVQKIKNDAPLEKEFFRDLIDWITILYNAKEQTIDDKFINNEFYMLLDKHDISEDSLAHFISDNLRHAFTHFIQGGVLQMYQYREAEVWYPKVIIRKRLGLKTDIDTLEKEVIIYRGMSIDEHSSQNYAQSWTLDEKIAKSFAFQHYIGQPDYQDTIRIVSKTKIKIDHIFYYDEKNKEQEVIIDERMLDPNKVEIIERKIIN